MTIAEARQLKAGDRVFWSDPCEGECSKWMTIQSISINEPNPPEGDFDDTIISITDENSNLECYACELSLTH